ncbi:hypothetical protein CTAM01_10210 [Colletotrichum tamarilloi]|uniref:Uncharacterized protein n=1 Tax=Colletotrichum tamarilloi TaxID=1209934 RepID=A0ABQ9R131_9PEZI|nr:uncharacterized protein CTAM01_10210 [Colletotrichum tamarilloi]KAK1491887.1 hypothetical protein CTAM01_10210 [Colletotrichum tamarilloi]
MTTELQHQKKAVCLLRRAASLTPACCLTTDLSSVAGLASNQSANDEKGERLLCTEGGDKIHTFTGHPS